MKQSRAQSKLVSPAAPARAKKTTTHSLHKRQARQLELETQNAELSRAHAALEASHARYVTLYELAPVGYLTLSERGMIMGIIKSPRETTWLNVTAAPLPLEGYGVVIAYGDIGERIRAERALAVTICFRGRATRERRWASVQSAPILDPQGNLQFVVSVNHAITLLKQNEQSLEQRNAELAFLNHASHALNSTLDLHRVLDALLEQANELFHCSASSIWIVDAAADAIVCQQATGASSHAALGFRLGVGEGIAGWIAQNGAGLIVPDTRQDARYVAAFAEKFGCDFRSIMGVPLVSHNTTIGVLELLDASPDRFHATDQMLRGRAPHAGGHDANRRACARSGARPFADVAAGDARRFRVGGGVALVSATPSQTRRFSSRVRGERVAVELRAREGILALTIHDNGIGIDLARALNDAFAGESIGLLGIKERAALLGGDVEFLTAPGKGTQVQVRLPLAPDATLLERRQNQRGDS